MCVCVYLDGSLRYSEQLSLKTQTRTQQIPASSHTCVMRGGRTLNNRGRAAPCQEQQSLRSMEAPHRGKKMNKWEIQIQQLTVSSAEQVTSRLSSKGEKAMSVTRSEQTGGKTHSKWHSRARPRLHFSSQSTWCIIVCFVVVVVV